MQNLIYYLILFVFSFGISVFIQKKEVSTLLKEKLYPNSRQVISTLEAKFDEKSTNYKIVKIKSSGKVLLEIFKQNGPDWLSKAEFTYDDRYDGYFNHDSKASNLFLKDIDGDNINEIILPSYDSNFNARINVVKYKVETEEFEKLAH